jgi:outer membrane protein assembly factor BamB
MRLRTPFFFGCSLTLGLAALSAAGCHAGAAAGEGQALPRAQATAASTASGSVLQHHNSGTRDGVYTDAAFTKTAIKGAKKSTTFTGTAMGATYAQPLFVRGAVGGADALFAATESNVVYASDAKTGTVLWTRKFGPGPALDDLQCGNIDPLGITGTPIVDVASSTLFVAAMVSPDGGRTKKHLIYALNLEDGAVKAGWPVDVAASVKVGGVSFPADVQNQRGALAIQGNTLYVPYGGHFGDCGDYRGWVVAVPLDDPSSPKAWVTQGPGSGIWAPNGVATDGQSVFVATGNGTAGDSNWGGNEAIVRIPADLSFSNDTKDFFSPSNWLDLDGADADLGGSGVVLVDVPGSGAALPSHYAVALGKSGVAHVTNRDDLGGIGRGNGVTGEGLSSKRLANNAIILTPAAFTDEHGSTFLITKASAVCPSASGVAAIHLPALTKAWCSSSVGNPIVSTTDGHAEAVVWTVSTGAAAKLVALDAADGTVLFQTPVGAAVQRFANPIVADGRVFVATDDGLVAFDVR